MSETRNEARTHCNSGSEAGTAGVLAGTVYYSSQRGITDSSMGFSAHVIAALACRGELLSRALDVWEGWQVGPAHTMPYATNCLLLLCRGHTH